MNAPNEFSKEQQAYFQGLMLGVDVARKVKNLPVLSGSATQGTTFQIGGKASTVSKDTNASLATASPATWLPKIHADAQDRFVEAGKTLVAEEKAKREKNGLEMWAEIGDRAAKNEFPKGTDVFLTKYHGLFFVAPAQNSFMCRMRLPGGVINSHQFRGLADVAEKYAGGYADITTRANLQLREIAANNALNVLMGLRDLGIVTQGSGADNIRNVTASTLSGIDPTELIETLPFARELHYHIMHRPELYGLPRKFNIAYDGSGRVTSLAETNDISFHAVTVSEQASSEQLPSGIYFLLGLGGITGHGDFARSTGVLVKPNESLSVCDAILRVFIKHGDRTDRKKARLKYVLDAMGFDKFLSEVEKELAEIKPGTSLRRVAADQFVQPQNVDRWAHVDVHPQKQSGLYYVGVVLPVGRVTSDQLRGLAKFADTHGTGEIRLTVWQNLIIPHIQESNLSSVCQSIIDLGLDFEASTFRAGLVACTGSAGCKFAGADTKANAMELAAILESQFHIDSPINIHVTGCHHSCAQHAIGDIGLIATKVEVPSSDVDAEDGETEMVDGYDILVGGRTGGEPMIGTKVFEKIRWSECPSRIAKIIDAYLNNRKQGDCFDEFSKDFDWQGWGSLALNDNALAHDKD